MDKDLLYRKNMLGEYRHDIKTIAKTLMIVSFAMFFVGDTVWYFLFGDESSIDSYTGIMVFGIPLALLVMNHYRKKMRFIDVDKSNRKRMKLSTIFSIICILIIIQIVAAYISDGFEYIMNLFGYTIMGEIESSTEVSDTLDLFIYSCIAAPIIEEIIFRKFVAGSLRKYGKVIAIVLSSIAFGLYHGNYTQGIFAAMVGAVFAYVAFEYSFKWSVFFHMLNNTYTDVIDYLPESVSDVVYIILGVSALLYLLYYLVKIVRRKGTIKKYIRENNPNKFLYKYTLTSLWVILFIVYSLWLAYLGVEPL